MLAMEERWVETVMSGFAVADGSGLAPRAGQIDWLSGARDFLERASMQGRLGVRLGVLLVMSAPLWLWGRLRSAATLSAVERAQLLDELLEHRVFAIRELTLLLKLVSCMALFRDASLRARSTYDRPLPRQQSLPVMKEVA